MPISSLTTGCIQSIMTGTEVEKPVLQILGTKKIASGNDSERYRILISDGKYLNSFAMLATQLNHLQQEDKLKENTIVRLERYTTSMVNKTDKADKRVMIILELTILNDGREVGQKIGNPQTFNPADAASAPAAAAASAPKPTMNNNNYAKNNNVSMNQSINSGHLISPIASLSPYNNKWVIKVRCMSKSQIRTWNNAKGEGKLFSMDFCDQSGEIRATAFRDDVDKYYDLIKQDGVYLISKCTLKAANKQFNHLKNDYEMTFGSETVIQPCEDDNDDSIPTVQYNFTPINRIAEMEDKSMVDICGVVKEIGEIVHITSKTTNKEFKKRELIVVDQSEASIALQIWGDDAVNLMVTFNPLLLLKELDSANSMELKVLALELDPFINSIQIFLSVIKFEDARTGGAGGGSMSTEWLSFFDVRARNLGNGDRPDYFQTKATIQMIRGQNAIYKACSSPDCNKKVVDEGESFRCEKCNITSHTYKARFLVNMSISDWTSNRWVTCFNDLVEQMLGKSASEVDAEIQASAGQEGNENEPFSKMFFQSYVFKLRCKVETYGDSQRNKFTAVAATPLNYKEYNKHLIGDLSRLTGIGKN
uniref:Replication protein A subunit n=1 Tax=Megaselia scalaris TaxID=36166 RepID=T1GRY7_MEGSC